MNIIAFSFDADGCFYHENYCLALFLNQVAAATTKTDKREYFERVLIRENQHFLESIKQVITEYDKAMTYVGSFRQCFEIDREGSLPKTMDYSPEYTDLALEIIERYNLPNQCLNSITTDGFLSFTDLFFNSILTISEFIGAEFNPLLMADILGGKKIGVSFKKAQKQTQDQLPMRHASSWEAD